MARLNWKTVLLSFLILTTFYACDKVTGEDTVQPVSPKKIPTTMYVQTGNSALMSFTAFVSSATQISISKNAQNGVVSFEQNQFIRYAPKAGITEGVDSFSLKINDKETTVKVTIVPLTTTSVPCEAGALFDKTISNKNSPVSVYVFANDKFCKGIDTTTFRIVAQPQNGQLVVNGGTLVYTPKRDFVGFDKVIYSVSGRDSTQLNSIAEVYYNIINPNLCQIDLKAQYIDWSPTFSSNSVTIDVFANSVLCDLPKSSLFITNLPQSGTAKISGDKIIYTLNGTTTTNKTDIISYALKDTLGVTYNSFVQINLSECKVKLENLYGELTVRDTVKSISFNIIAANINGFCPNSSIGIDSQPANGKAEFSSNTVPSIVYTPNAGFKGIDDFTYKVTNAAGFIHTANIKVKVD
jgi:large repetitive protein